MTEKKSRELPPMPKASSDSGKYARRLLDKKPHCRPCSKRELGIEDSLAQGAGVKPLKENYGWDLPHAKKIYCKKCKAKTWHDQWTGHIFRESAGPAQLSPKLEKRIKQHLGPKDAFGLPVTEDTMVDHKSPHTRWETGDQPKKNDMSDAEIEATFQLYPKTSWNSKKDREGCRICIKTDGKEGRIPIFQNGWPDEIPKKGKDSTLGCKGCFWYDTSEYLKENLNSGEDRTKFLNKLEKELSKLHEDYEEKMTAIQIDYETAITEIDREEEIEIEKIQSKQNLPEKALIWTSFLFMLPGTTISIYYNNVIPFLLGTYLTFTTFCILYIKNKN